MFPENPELSELKERNQSLLVDLSAARNLIDDLMIRQRDLELENRKLQIIVTRLQRENEALYPFK